MAIYAFFLPNVAGRWYAFRPVSGSMWQSVEMQIMADQGRARYSQIQPCTVLKSMRFEDIKYDTERYVWGINWGIIWGIIWGMSGVLSGACLGHHLGHVWGIIWGMSGASSWACLGHHLKACLGHSKISAVLNASSVFCALNYQGLRGLRPLHSSARREGTFLMPAPLSSKRTWSLKLFLYNLCVTFTTHMT